MASVTGALGRSDVTDSMRIGVVMRPNRPAFLCTRAEGHRDAEQSVKFISCVGEESSILDLCDMYPRECA